MQKIVKNALAEMAAVTDILPNIWVVEAGFSSLKDCLFSAHHPKSLNKTAQARDYLAFEELIAHHFALQKIKKSRQNERGIIVKSAGKLRQLCLENLPFKPTAAQSRVADEILADLTSPHPMQRLLQGDVGSGKTLVALLSALDCVESGGQCALMVPTELLATQHYQNIQQLIEHLPVRCCLLTGGLSAKIRQQVMNEIADGTANIVIGTHALIQKTVIFHRLTYVIIDEQHRFGVAQRTELSNKAQKNHRPNQLLMTATPIPRTLAMSFYAFLDVSIIDELPPGRTPVATSSVHEKNRGAVIERLNEYCQSGKQVYWVCPLIEESETLQCQTALKTFEDLSAKLPNLTIALVHGQIKNKSEIMADFKAHKADILVATTVIEVGVDVPNASLMIIDNSERLGLSQLHQLRGRVGRGAIKSQCVLLCKTPLSRNAKARLDIMRQTNDGFVIAEQDLKIRGAGELLGIAQAGEVKFRLADFTKDQRILRKILSVKTQLSQSCPDNCQTELINRWQIKQTVA